MRHAAWNSRFSGGFRQLRYKKTKGMRSVWADRLMGLLVTRGCIINRSARRTGRLVHATAEETLAHLRRPPERVQADGGAGDAPDWWCRPRTLEDD